MRKRIRAMRTGLMMDGHDIIINNKGNMGNIGGEWGNTNSGFMTYQIRVKFTF